MTEFKMPRTEIEWSRRAIINVVEVLAAHAESLTLIGAHAVLLRTMDLDVPRMPTGDGDLGVTPGLVGDLPSLETLLADAGYEHRTTARPGLWGREPYDEPDGTRSYRESEKWPTVSPTRQARIYSNTPKIRWIGGSGDPKRSPKRSAVIHQFCCRSATRRVTGAT